MWHNNLHCIAPRTPSLVLLAVAGALLVHAVAVLPALLSADALLQRTHARPKQQSDERAVAAAASIVKKTVGTWHTAQLSVARYDLSATSLPSQGLALFAGGYTIGVLSRQRMC